MAANRKEKGYAAPERFEVSHLGMRELHTGREPWQLLKELVQNVWDEAPEATVCAVAIRPAKGEYGITVRVADDGPGFRDLTDAWTLMKHTPKRSDPKKRGRFNMGEKELVSVAVEAEIETVGHTVSFPRIGGRIITANTRERGTVVTALMPWDPGEAESLTERMTRFRPTDCRLTVNGVEVLPRKAIAARETVLNTVILDAESGQMRSTRRKCRIDLLQPHPGQESWLYEMGIPVQTIAAAWDMDVQQKIPMPPNRNTVPEYYLTDLYAEALNAAHEMMEQKMFGEQWVKQACEDDRVDTGAIISVVNGRYGEKALLTSSNAESNMQAIEAGYEVINPRSLSAREKERFQREGGMTTTHAVFGRRDSGGRTLNPEEAETHAGFTRWVREMASLCGLKATVELKDDPRSRVVAQCTADTTSPVVTFNVSHPSLGEGFHSPPYGRREQLELVIHELGHALASTPMEHGPRWGQGAAQAGAMIAAGISKENATVGPPEPGSTA